MDLILWRHAEAQVAKPDLNDMDRALTNKGTRQAALMGEWLDKQLPEGAKIWSSPAKRCEQTVAALGRKYKVRADLGTAACVQDLLDLSQWPDAKFTAVIVGHQPVLGQVAAQLLGLTLPDLNIKKGAVWWFRHRPRTEGPSTRLVCVQDPDFL
jgi:phosphohistidine phosphatase